MPGNSALRWVGAIIVVALMGTALVSPLYPLYQRAWQISSGDITLIYVIYMVGSLLSLLMLGRLADQIGYFRVLTLALVLCFIGTVLSAMADGFRLFATGRFLVGIAASLTTSGGAVALMKLSPPNHRHSLALRTSLLISGGFALGPLTGGAMGQWAPSPLVTTYLPGIALLLICFAGLVVTVPRPAGAASLPSARSLLPKLAWTDRSHSLALGLACCLPFISFGVFGLYASLAPTLIHDILALEGPLVSGGFIGLFLLCVAVTQFSAHKLPARRATLVSLVLIAIGNLGIMANVTLASPALFAVGVLIGAVGHGLSVLASTSVMIRVSRDDNRGALTATYWAIGYSGSIFPMLMLGWMADRMGVAQAVSIFCIGMASLCALVFILTAWLGPRDEKEGE